MGLEDNVAAARAIAACSDLLLLADGDTGYGNALNAYHTVRAFERAGVAGLMLEDQVWPKRCGHLKGKEVISAEEMVQKIRAAAEARVDPDFVIKSRTDVLATHGVAGSDPPPEPLRRSGRGPALRRRRDVGRRHRHDRQERA